MTNFETNFEEEFEASSEPLPPHKYPLWIIFFVLTISVGALYSLFLLPKYIGASIKIREAECAFDRADYDNAVKLYVNILESVPSSKKARIGAAEAVFANPNIKDKEAGLIFLEGIDLNQENRDRINKVMPSEYQQHFKDKKH